MDTETLDFTRTISATPSRVFAILTDSGLRQSWNTPGEGFKVTVTHPANAAPGARETALVTSETDPDTTVQTDWTTVTPTTLAYCETLETEGTPLTSSFAVTTLQEEGEGTKVTFHVYLVSFVGPEMIEGYRMGWTAAVDALADMT